VGSNPHEIALDVVTPEPATLFLWGTGAAGVGVIRWRRRQRAKAQATLSDSRKRALTRGLLPMLMVASFVLMPTPARAIPTCSAGTMADYIALTDGCQIGGVMTVSDFSYFGFREFFGAGFSEIPASDIGVVPSLPYGPSGMRLTFLGGWSGVEIDFRIDAEGPWIQQYVLFLLRADNGAGVSAGGLTVGIGPGEVAGPGVPGTAARRSFIPIDGEFIHLTGVGRTSPIGVLGDFAFDAVAPEPATLLLWGTGAAGLGLARWVKRRRTSDHAA
jgi:hypothetical protein